MRVPVFVLLLIAHGCVRRAQAQERTDAGRSHTAPSRDAALRNLAAIASSVGDAGPPDAASPPAQWSGRFCLRPGDAGVTGATIEYSTCTDGLACVVDANSRELTLHAFWWGQIASGCLSANGAVATCTITPRAAALRSRSVRVDGSHTLLEGSSATAGDAGAMCWNWPPPN